MRVVEKCLPQNCYIVIGFNNTNIRIIIILFVYSNYTNSHWGLETVVIVPLTSCFLSYLTPVDVVSCRTCPVDVLFPVVLWRTLTSCFLSYLSRWRPVSCVQPTCTRCTSWTRRPTPAPSRGPGEPPPPPPSPWSPMPSLPSATESPVPWQRTLFIFSMSRVRVSGVLATHWILSRQSHTAINLPVRSAWWCDMSASSSNKAINVAWQQCVFVFISFFIFLIYFFRFWAYQKYSTPNT